jgi:hypothetical protein
MARGLTFAAPWRVDRFAFKALAASELGRKSHGGRGAAACIQTVCSVEHQEAVAAEGEKRDRRQVNS